MFKLFIYSLCMPQDQFGILHVIEIRFEYLKVFCIIKYDISIIYIYEIKFDISLELSTIDNQHDCK